MLGSEIEVTAGAPEVPSEPDAPVGGGELQLEVGESQVNHNWKTVALDKTFRNPVVLVKPLSLNGDAPQ